MFFCIFSSECFYLCLTILSLIVPVYPVNMPDLAWIWPVRAISASGQPESGRIRFAESDFPHPIRIRIGCFFSAPEVAGIIIIGSGFVHLARFQYRCVELNEARSDPPPTKQTRTTSGMSILGRVFIDRSESDPFLYIWPGSDIDALSSEI